MKFHDFKRNVAVASVLAALGLRDELQDSTSFGDLNFLAQPDTDEDGEQFVRRVRRYAGVCSSGEAVVLAALLYLLGRDDLADEMDEGRTWHRIHRVSGEFRSAVAGCINPER